MPPYQTEKFMGLNKMFSCFLKLFLIVGFLMLTSCGDDPVPKPKAFLRLEFPEAHYVKTYVNIPFSFETNTLATKLTTKKLESTTESYGINIEYSSLRGTLFLTYKDIHSNPDNLKAFLLDAQNFTQKHTIKADEIEGTPYENEDRKVYGMFYKVGGNVASQSQFYVTDSINHFLTGSLYFYAKPNYDSILPAANYLEKDIKHLMETLEWK